jgi:hypothetical protein
MCLKCDLIDKEIERLKKLDEPGLDALSRAMMRADLESWNAEKADLHCDGIINVAAPPLSPETDWRC